MFDRVIGLDVCCDRVVACLVTELPASVREFYHDYEFQQFPLNWSGFNDLMALQPTVAVYEPTGVAYSAVWVHRLREAGVICKGVDHAKLRAYRKALELPDKDDFADSLALACYYLDPMKQSKFSFIRERTDTITEIRRLTLRLQHLDRRKSPIINRLRQDLTIAFPEVANKDCDSAPLFWGWMAGERVSKRYDQQYKETIGLGISPDMVHEAKALITCHREEAEIERKLSGLIASEPAFAPYLKVLRRFHFGNRIEALLLSQIYPLEDFLKDGQPEVRVKKGRNSGKPTTRYHSLRRFQKAMGVAPVREESGDVKKKRRGGSSLCRKALWQWCFTWVETWRKRKTSNALILEIREIYKAATLRFSSLDVSSILTEQQMRTATQTKARGVRVKLARAYTRRKISIILFNQLVQEICSQ